MGTWRRCGRFCARLSRSCDTRRAVTRRPGGRPPSGSDWRWAVRIALFATCLADTMFPAAAKATVLLLERLGHEVVFPAEQTCCGQMHINTGYQKDALPLVRRHVKTFEPYDVVVAPSGSCVGSVRHQHAMVAARTGRDAGLAARAETVASRTYELSELLV